jgi:hypothetical protein
LLMPHLSPFPILPNFVLYLNATFFKFWSRICFHLLTFIFKPSTILKCKFQLVFPICFFNYIFHIHFLNYYGPCILWSFGCHAHQFYLVLAIAMFASLYKFQNLFKWTSFQHLNFNIYLMHKIILQICKIVKATNF